MRGFSRETFIEITNIESQEFRRCQNNTIGCAEHPRAGGTDDLETFFSLIHRYVGNSFTLKQYKEFWPKKKGMQVTNKYAILEGLHLMYIMKIIKFGYFYLFFCVHHFGKLHCYCKFLSFGPK